MSIAKHIAELPQDSNDPIARLTEVERAVLLAWGSGAEVHSYWWVEEQARSAWTRLYRDPMDQLSRAEVEQILSQWMFLGLVSSWDKDVFRLTPLGYDTLKRMEHLKRHDPAVGEIIWAVVVSLTVIGGIVAIAMAN